MKSNPTIGNINTNLLAGSTPLHNAARDGDTNSVRLLLSQGEDCNAKDAAGKTPLDYASNSKIKELLIDSANARLLLPEFNAQKKFDQLKENIKTEDDKNKLIHSLLNYPEFYSDMDNATIEKLIEKVFNYNINGNDQLIVPIAVAEVPVIQAPAVTTTTTNTLILNENVNTSYPERDDESEDNRKPLVKAASAGNAIKVTNLIEQGADVNEIDRDGFTALYYAYNPEVIRILVDNGAGYTNRGGTAAIHFASSSQNIPLLNFLIDEKNVNTNAMDAQKRTPMHYAVYPNKSKMIKNLEIIKKLLDNDGAIDAVDNFGATPFFYLIKNHKKGENKELIEFFINNNVNLNINIFNESIFNYALELCDKWLLEKLINKGIDIGAGVNSFNPLDYSIQKLMEIGINKENIIYALKKYNFHISQETKIDIIQKYFGAESVQSYNEMNVNDYNYDLPTQENVENEIKENLFKNIIQRLKEGEDKNSVIDTIIDSNVDNATKEILMQKVWDYDVNTNLVTTQIATPVAVAPAPAQAPVKILANATLPSEEKLSAEIKVRLFNGENKEDLINFVSLFPDIREDAQGIRDQAREDLVNYICEYSFGTELSGRIGADTHF